MNLFVYISKRFFVKFSISANKLFSSKSGCYAMMTERGINYYECNRVHHAIRPGNWMRFSLLLAPGQTAHAPSLQYGPFCACATITVWTNLRMRHHYSTGQTAHTPPLQYTEDYVRCSGNLINLSGPGVTVCPLVQVPLSGVGCAESIRDMANLDSWILSAKLPRNIVLWKSREKLWASLCSSASAFLDQSPPCSVLYLPIS